MTASNVPLQIGNQRITAIAGLAFRWRWRSLPSKEVSVHKLQKLFCLRREKFPSSHHYTIAAVWKIVRHRPHCEIFETSQAYTGDDANSCAYFHVAFYHFPAASLKYDIVGYAVLLEDQVHNTPGT